MTMGSAITWQEKRDFHNIDRQVYTRLVTEIGLDLLTSKKIVAFWFWIETEGFRHLIMNLVSLATPILSAVAMEAITCLDVLYSLGFVDVHEDTPFMRCLVSQGFSLEAIYERRDRGLKVIERFIKDVCDDVFSDIFPEYKANEVKVEDFVPCKEESDKSNSAVDNYVRQYWDFDSKNERTLFITFSKGHPISKPELRNLITR